MEWLLKLVLSAFELVLSFRFCNCYLDLKEEIEKIQIIYAITFLAVAGTILNSFFVSNIINLIISLMVIFIVLLCFKGTKARKTLIGTIYVVFSMMLDIAVALLIDLLFGAKNSVIEQENMKMFFALILYYVIKFIIVYYLKAGKKSKIQMENSGIYIKQGIIPIISIGFLYYFLNTQLQMDKMNYRLCYMVILVFAIINVVLYMIYENTERLYISNYNHMLMNERMKYRENYYQDVEKHQAEIRMIRHNLKNQLLAISGCLEQDNIKKVKEEIEAVIHDIVRTEGKIFTRNIEVNALLNAKYATAAEQQILCEFHVNIPERLALTSGEIGIVIGNALDNAIEACMQCELDKRKIELILNYHSTCMMLVLTNSTKGIVKSLVTQKENAKDHGFGLASIENVTKKYHGDMNHKSTENAFRLEITLWNV